MEVIFCIKIYALYPYNLGMNLLIRETNYLHIGINEHESFTARR